MKARVKGTGEIVTIMKNIGYPGGYVASNGRTYHDEDLTLIVDEDPDYWARFEHQAAIAAMQGMLNNSLLITGLLKVNKSHEDIVAEVTSTAIRYAHALVEKMKEADR